MAAKRRFIRLGSVRARTTLAATLVVGVALLAGAGILVGVLRASLIAGVDDSLRARSVVIEPLLSRTGGPGPLPASNDDTSLVQILGPTGSVLYASANIEGEPAVLVPQTPQASGTIRTVGNLPVGEGGSFRILSRQVPTPAGTATVYLAGSLATTQRSVAVVGASLAVGLPLLLALVALTAWMVVGRALSPVEDIRAEVAEISTLALDRRVSEPAVVDEVGRLARTMNEMLDRLRASALRHRQFVSDASHELRSPIAAIRTQLEVASGHPAETNWQETATDVLKDVDRMQRLVAQLLDLARLDEGAPSRRDQAVDLDELLLREARRTRERSDLLVDVHEVSAGRVLGNPDQLQQVVRNLIDNATRHARSRITFGLRAQAGMVALSVADDGPGIPPGDRERIFERFTRLDQARAADQGGAGLGLAITREIVVAHGGSITVEDVAVGARLTVRLPLDPAHGDGGPGPNDLRHRAKKPRSVNRISRGVPQADEALLSESGHDR